MRNELRFGKLLFQDGSKPSQVTKRRFLYLIPAVFLFVIGFILLTDPALLDENPEDARIPSYVMLFSSAFYFFLIFFIVKGYYGAIYEHGFVIKHGSKTIARSFDELKELYSFKKSIVIVECTGKSNGMFSYFVPNLQQFTEELASAHAKYWIRTLSPENLNKVEISFGTQLKLANGIFIYKKGKKTVPLNDVYYIEIIEQSPGSPETELAMFKGIDGEDLLIAPTAYMINMEVFNHIAYMISESELHS
jgi:hypothetical protein